MQRFLRPLAVLTTALLLACRPQDTAPVPLKDLAPFPVGASISPTLLKNNAAYRNVLSTEFSSISVENAQKWGTIHPEQTRFNFTDAETILDWARANGKRVHGHTLLWHSYNPAWLTNFQGDSTAWENLMKTHIHTVVTHFKGRVASWDVVNEAFSDAGTLRNVEAKPEDGSVWRQHLGPDYIARAFRYAHEADPAALLFFNEFGQESNPAKLKATVDLAADFKRRSVPIHGLGLQFHLGVSQSENGLSEALRQTAAAGLLVHISELDILVSDWKKDPTLQYTDALQNRQSAKYKFIAQTYRLLVPKAQQHGITTWNVGDSDSWITQGLKYTDWPLLFDANYERKKAYFGFAEGLKN